MGSRAIVRTAPGRAYIQIRGLEGKHGKELAEATERAVARMKGVRGAQVNPVLASVVVAFDDGAVDLEDVASMVGSLEEARGADPEGFDDHPAHPADTAPINRAATALLADALGIGVAVAARLLRAPALPVEFASAITGVESLPAVRRILSRRPRLATGSASLNAIVQGLGQGPLGLIVDAIHRSETIAELSVRREAWLALEEQLHPTVRPDLERTPTSADRPVPLPATLAERYAQTSSLTALGAAMMTLGLTGNPVRSADVLLAGIPRAAQLGVESFASVLGVRLADRDVMVMDPSVLRRLDVIDTVVVDASLHDAELASEELFRSVRAAAHDLVIAGKRSALAADVDADFSVAGGSALPASVRRLQEEGRVVAVVSSRSTAALLAADLGIGVKAPGHRTPWGADLICTDPRDTPALVDATRLARDASRLSAGLAAAGSLTGAVSAFGPKRGAGRRAVTAVQVAALTAMAAGAWTASKLPGRAGNEDAASASELQRGSDERGRQWHALEPEQVLAELATTLSGLDSEEAVSRAAAEAARHNGGASGRPGVIGMLAKELCNPLTAVLGAGAALSAVTGSVVDSALIGGAVVADAGIGVAQRLRTEAAIAELRRALKGGSSKVLRDGEATRLDPEDLVPGDVVEFHAGDAVHADARVLNATALEIDESALTGESMPVRKTSETSDTHSPVAERSGMVFAGSSVAAGHGRAVVVAVGDDSEARKGSELAGDWGPGDTIGVESRLRSLTDKTIPVILAAGAGLTMNGLLRGAPPRDAVAAGVSLAASAVPEGLPFVATAAQTAAARRLARSDVLVRNPQVLEALGRVDVLCFDKTGTLTEGRLRVTRISDGERDQSVADLSNFGRRVLSAALRATPRARPGGLPHPTDQAVVDAADRTGVTIGEGVPGWKKTGSLPFEPGRGYHAVRARSEAGQLISVKGAPEVVLPRCRAWRAGAGNRTVGFGPDQRRTVDREVRRLAGQGLRVLAVAERNGSGAGREEMSDGEVRDLELLGFVGVADEARTSAAEPLRQLDRAGIRVVMITGDHPSTAEAVAKELGLMNGHSVMTGPELDGMSDDQLDEVIEQAAVFARVAPAHKVRIVAAFQRAGRVVAMTGDGANDAQAIRLAHVGVAFGERSTPAARAAADIVVARDDLGALIETMVEGRAMWASVREALAILLGGNLGEVVFSTGGSLVTGRPPLGPRQLLTVNLFTDLVPAIAISVRPPRPGRVNLEREGPETSLSGRLARDVAIRACATSGAAFGGWLSARATGTPGRARTVALVSLVGSQLGQTMVVGRRSPMVLVTAGLSAAVLAAAIQTPGVSQFFGCRPMGPVGWGIALGWSTAATAASVAADLLVP